MGININANTINDLAQTTKNVTQIAANLTKQHQEKPQEKPKPDNFNQPHTQTVEVKVGEQGQTQKPVIIKEKPETHVHKVFPDNRELSERECTVRELELKQDHEYRMKELDHRIYQEELARKERKEREERYEKDRERRRERDRKTARKVGIVVGAACVVAAGVTAYCFYTDTWLPSHRRVAIPASEAVTPTPVEGSVK